LCSDKIKAHDFQYWAPLIFNDTVSPPSIQQFVWIDQFSLELA
jgi:hypothetical protein